MAQHVPIEPIHEAQPTTDTTTVVGQAATQQPEAPAKTSLKRSLVRYLFVIIPLLVAVLPHLSFQPLWDAAVYLGCIKRSVDLKLDVWTLNCANHPSVASLLAPAIAYHWSNGAVWAVHVANLVLAIIAAACFLSTLDKLFPETSGVERCLAAACMSATPVIAGSIIHTNSDYGTLIFAVILLCALVHRSRVLIALACAALPLTKDLGLPVCAIIVASYLITFVLRQEGSLLSKLKTCLYFWPVIAAALAFAWYASGRLSRDTQLFLPPTGNSATVLLAQALAISLTDPVLQAYLSAIFVINFSWILTVFIVVACIVAICRWCIGTPRGQDSARAELVFLMLILSVLLFTRFRTFVNARYFLPIYPMVVMASFHSMVRVLPWSRARSLVLACALTLILGSSFRTIDPLAKKIFGTFKFGKHDILKMTSVTGECCGLGRDQLVYNTEFTYFYYLANDVLADIRPHSGLPLIMAPLSRFYYIDWITKSDIPQRVALAGTNTILAPVSSAGQLDGIPTESLPSRIVWLDVPNVDGTLDYSILLRRYKVLQEKIYDRQGYQLRAAIMEKL